MVTLALQRRNDSMRDPLKENQTEIAQLGWFGCLVEVTATHHMQSNVGPIKWIVVDGWTLLLSIDQNYPYSEH